MHFRRSNWIRDENYVLAEFATRVTLELIKLGIVRRAEISGVRMRASSAVRLQMRRGYLFIVGNKKTWMRKPRQKCPPLSDPGMQPHLYAHLVGHNESIVL